MIETCDCGSLFCDIAFIFDLVHCCGRVVPVVTLGMEEGGGAWWPWGPLSSRLAHRAAKRSKVARKSSRPHVAPNRVPPGSQRATWEKRPGMRSSGDGCGVCDVQGRRHLALESVTFSFVFKSLFTTLKSQKQIEVHFLKCWLCGVTGVSHTPAPWCYRW